MLPLACNMRLDIPSYVIWTFVTVFFILPAALAVFGLVWAGLLRSDRKATSLLAQISRRRDFAGKPLRIFLMSLVLPALLYVGCSIAIVRLWADCTGLERFLVWLCALISSGMFAALLYLWTEERATRAAVRPPSNTFRRVWLQDPIVTVLCFGAGLTLLWFAQSLHQFDSQTFLMWATYLFVVGASGLAMALDLGRSSSLGQMAAPRAVLFVLIYTLMPLLFPALWLAWWRWRKFNAARAAEVQAKTREAQTKTASGE